MFAESLAFVARLGFSRMHVFPYSRRTGTPAARMADQVPEPVKKERVHRMQALAREKTAAFEQSFLGETLRVLFETRADGVTDGLTDNYIRVYVADDLPSGTLAAVRLERLYRDGVWGSVVRVEK